MEAWWWCFWRLIEWVLFIPIPLTFSNSSPLYLKLFFIATTRGQTGKKNSLSSLACHLFFLSYLFRCILLVNINLQSQFNDKMKIVLSSGKGGHGPGLHKGKQMCKNHERPWFSRGSSVNPLLARGKKADFGSWEHGNTFPLRLWQGHLCEVCNASVWRLAFSFSFSFFFRREIHFGLCFVESLSRVFSDIYAENKA